MTDNTPRPSEHSEPETAKPTKGYDALWGWFCLSYASWLVLPRCLMHAVPDRWQLRMAALLHEFNETFEGDGETSYNVKAMRDGKFVKMPHWASRHFYRHPDPKVIDSMRVKRIGTEPSDAEGGG
jgi:hypothetical protein